MDSQILSLYNKDLATREIFTTFKEMDGVDVSSTLISKVIDAAYEDVMEWHDRLLDITRL